MPGHRRERQYQPRVDLAGQQLAPGRGRHRNLGGVQQRGAGCLTPGQIRVERSLVGGRAIRRDHPDGDRGGAVPKDARTAGAQAVARALPNSSCTVAVSTTKTDGTGSGDAGPSTTSLLAGKPWARSAAHITASQDTVTSGLTCSATHAAACARTAARGPIRKRDRRQRPDDDERQDQRDHATPNRASRLSRNVPD